MLKNTFGKFSSAQEQLTPEQLFVGHFPAARWHQHVQHVCKVSQVAAQATSVGGWRPVLATD